MRAGAVLFDLDGVLIDSRAAITACINHALSAHGLEPRDPAALARFIGPPLHEAFSEIAGPAAAPSCVAAYRERYRTTAASETVVFEGVPEMLAAVAAPKAVATSKPALLAEPLLRALGLRGHFEAVAGPSPEVRAEQKAVTVGRALEALGHPEAPVMVGDRIHDVRGARAHGIPCIGVLWGIGDEQELAGADALVRTPAELAELLA